MIQGLQRRGWKTTGLISGVIVLELLIILFGSASRALGIILAVFLLGGILSLLYHLHRKLTTKHGGRE